jgi:hypothetical protein
LPGAERRGRRDGRVQHLASFGRSRRGHAPLRGRPRLRHRQGPRRGDPQLQEGPQGRRRGARAAPRRAADEDVEVEVVRVPKQLPKKKKVIQIEVAEDATEEEIAAARAAAKKKALEEES